MNGEIQLITGTLGGGKTLLAVEKAVNHLRRGGHVYTNIEIIAAEVEKWLACQGLQFEPERLHVIPNADIKQFHKNLERGEPDMRVYVIIDEAGLEFNCRDYRELNRDLLNFNVLVRKFDICLIYIAQKPEMLDKQFRGLCQTQVDCRNFKHYKIWGVFSMPIPLLFRVHYSLVWGKRQHMRTEPVFTPKWVYPLYNSDALLGDAAGKFASMGKATRSPLKRIKKLRLPRPSLPLSFFELFLASCVAFFLCS